MAIALFHLAREGENEDDVLYICHCTSHRNLPVSTTKVGRIWPQEECTQLEANSWPGDDGCECYVLSAKLTLFIPIFSQPSFTVVQST